MFRLLKLSIFAFALSCGGPKIKEHNQINSADMADDEDIIAERPAVISGSHLFCSEEPGVMDESYVNVVCTINDEVDYKQYIDNDKMVIELNGEVVPIAINAEGKFEFSVPQDHSFDIKEITVHDLSQDKKDESDEEEGKAEETQESPKNSAEEADAEAVLEAEIIEAAMEDSESEEAEGGEPESEEAGEEAEGKEEDTEEIPEEEVELEESLVEEDEEEDKDKDKKSKDKDKDKKGKDKDK